MLYEFVSPSDEITFYAPDDEIAQVVTIYVGNGKAGLHRQDEAETPNTMFLFSPPGKEVQETIARVMKVRLEEVIEAAHSFAVCGFSEREIYDDYTEHGSNKERQVKWHDKNRTSMSDFCLYAWGLRKSSELSKDASCRDTQNSMNP